MPIYISRALGGLKKFTSTSWAFFTGIIIVLVGFFANFTDYKQPDITVEITAVTTTSSDPVDVVRIPELSMVKEYLGIDGPFGFRLQGTRGPGLLVDEIDRQLLIATSQTNSEGADIDRQARLFDSLISNPKADQENQLNELEAGLSREPVITFNAGAGIPPDSKKTMSAVDRIQSASVRIRKLIESRRKNHAESTSKVLDAAKQWAAYKEKVLPNKARLSVTTAIGNQGSGATSLKPQGLLRANLGDGNYLDLPMRLSGYETSSELGVLPAKAFKVVRFQSDEVQSMNPADRQRYSTFLGNVSPATIYLTDVRGNKFASNSVPFSPGVYEQKVYDSLKQFASKAPTR